MYYWSQTLFRFDQGVHVCHGLIPILCSIPTFLFPTYIQCNWISYRFLEHPWRYPNRCSSPNDLLRFRSGLRHLDHRACHRRRTRRSRHGARSARSARASVLGHERAVRHGVPAIGWRAQVAGEGRRSDVLEGLIEKGTCHWSCHILFGVVKIKITPPKNPRITRLTMGCCPNNDP